MKRAVSVTHGPRPGLWPGLSLCTAGAILALALGWMLPGFADAKEPPEPGKVAAMHITLPPNLQNEQALYEAQLMTALEVVRQFFKSAGLSPDSNSLIDSVLVFNTNAEARQYLAATFSGKAEDIPETFAGTVVERSLYLVSSPAYQKIWKQLYADWPWTDSTYLQLIEHELAHRAHESIAISELSSTDAMGPDWFFEGLAVVCACQFVTTDSLLTKVQLEQLLGDGTAPVASYPLYGKVVRSILAQADLKTVLWQAAKPDFPMGLWNHAPVAPGH